MVIPSTIPSNASRLYTLEMLKVNSAVWLHNYHQTKRASYLNHAIAATCDALRIYRSMPK